MFGIRSETVVVTGALDQPAGALGAGNIHPGICSETTGAALAAVVTLEEPLIDPRRRLPCHVHGLPGMRYYLMPWGQTAGLFLKWFRDSLCIDLQGRDNAYELLSGEAVSVDPGCDGLIALPHITGAASPEFDPYAKAVFFGISLEHTRGHFIRAIMESVAFLLRKYLELLPELGIEIDSIRSLGGGSRSRLWNQIKADVLGKRVLTVEHSEESACVGAAMLAAVAVGVFRDLQEAASVMVRPKGEYRPSGETRTAYEVPYRTYLELYDSLYLLFRASTRT
jgi:xylulokinase